MQRDMRFRENHKIQWSETAEGFGIWVRDLLNSTRRRVNIMSFVSRAAVCALCVCVRYVFVYSYGV